jgi:hypothetical protein
MSILTAIITNLRPAGDPVDTLLCDVTCPKCSHAIAVSYGGWTSLLCNGVNGCGSTLQRFDRKITKMDPVEALGIVTCFVGLRTGNGCTGYEAANFVEASEDGAQITAALEIVRARWGL